MKSPLVLDFETRSSVDLSKTSATVYAKHPHTDIWFAKAGFPSTDALYTLKPEPMPDDLRRYVADGGMVSVHNAGFEWAIWNYICVPRYNWPVLPLEQMTCTVSRGVRMGLPPKLELMAPALRLPVEKDMAGNRLMKQMAKPRRWDGDTPVWWDDPDKLARIHAYGEQDVWTQIAVEEALPELSRSERRIWLETMRANLRGLRVDTEFVRHARIVVDRRIALNNQRLRDITNGVAKGGTDLNGIKRFANARLDTPVESFDKAHVHALLEDPNVPESVKEAAAIRQEVGKSSVAKLPAIQSHSDDTDRIYDLLAYHGASTGRWAGRGVQVQNFPSRGGVKWRSAEIYVDLIRQGALSPEEAVEYLELMESGSAIETLSMCLRSALLPDEGEALVCADYSNIEGRVGSWYGGEEWKLQAFREYDAGVGPDLYKVTAGGILGKSPEDVDKTERDVLGKVTDLSLQFQGGAGAYSSMAKVYGIDVADYAEQIKQGLNPEFWDQACAAYQDRGKKSAMRKPAWIAAEAIKIGWRDRHPGIVGAWYDIEDAAVTAIRNPGSVNPACRGMLQFTYRKFAGVPMLAMKLASGRSIFFPHAKLTPRKTPWGATKDTIEYKHYENGQFRWKSTYGGDAFQSAVQGTARDLMAAGWVRVADTGVYRPLFSVHDELAASVPKDRADLREYESLLCQLPKWATGCPVSAEGYVATRWRKG
jgi:DNA polymerase bacteriophage-type